MKDTYIWLLLIVSGLLENSVFMFFTFEKMSLFEMCLGLFIIALINIAVLILILKAADNRGTEYRKLININSIPEDFKIIYEKIYKTKINVLEIQRIVVALFTIMSYIAISAIFPIAIYVGLTLDKYVKPETRDFWEFAINGITIGGTIVIGFCTIFLKYKYEKKYKKEIIFNFIELLNNNLKYFLEDTNNLRKEYTNADFDGSSFNIYKEDDYIEGEISNNVFIKMANLLIENETKGYKGSRTVVTKFKGIFAYTSSDKDIKTCIKINADKNNKVLGAKNYKVEMDSREFEKYFDVYCDDKILAMRLLTTDIMEKLLEFYNKYRLKFEICYRNEKIYLRFFTGKMFEPKIFANSIDLKTLYLYYTIIQLIVEITETSNVIIKEIDI